ncbi:hypothetical protein HHI36_002679 [Cryptolaemus montrouzieri]|uniref:Uncharacterized protein n=1 Tax=Cryptolaemus montrouzieri TaxID=559131 RepID=A0ABD2PCR8_9CUCU
MSDDSGASVSDNSSENQSLEESIRIKKTLSKTVTFSRKLSCSSQVYLREIDATEATLLEIQCEESKEYEHFASLWKECELLEQIFQHFIQYLDCVKLEMKTTNRLSVLLNTLTLRENCLTENMSKNLKDLCQEPNLGVWNDLSSNIYSIMENFDSIREFKRKFEDDKNNYEIALKNFKMVLEFMSINLKDLEKLKKQFEKVLWDYQHSRCLLMKNMMQLKRDSMEFLGTVSGNIGKKNEDSMALRSQLGYLLGDLENAIDSNIQYSRGMFCNDDREINKIK